MKKSLLCLPAPKGKSHKGQNGVVLIIGGNRTYHGAPILAAKAACRFCDLVYFSSTTENMKLVSRMKSSSPNVICVPDEKFAFALSHADCVLIGNGMDPDDATRKMLSKILKSGKRCVVDAAALRVLPLRLVHEKAVLTPHSGEFKAAFGMPATPENARRASEKYGCAILLKGKLDAVACKGRLELVSGGNAGMTKGGTGDVLAGLCAALFSVCASPLKATYTASVLNKKAGEMLYRRKKFFFSSEDLAECLPDAAASLFRG